MSFTDFPRNYTYAKQTWARSRSDAPLVAPNTRLVRLRPMECGRAIMGPASFGIRLHATLIVRWDPDGSTRLAGEGWQTVTTLQRMREAGIRVETGNGVWSIRNRVFEDGMRILADGSIRYPEGTPNADRLADEERAEIRREDARRRSKLSRIARDRYRDIVANEIIGEWCAWRDLGKAEQVAAILENERLPIAELAEIPNRETLRGDDLAKAVFAFVRKRAKSAVAMDTIRERCGYVRDSWRFTALDWRRFAKYQATGSDR